MWSGQGVNWNCVNRRWEQIPYQTADPCHRSSAQSTVCTGPWTCRMATSNSLTLHKWADGAATPEQSLTQRVLSVEMQRLFHIIHLWKRNEGAVKNKYVHYEKSFQAEHKHLNRTNQVCLCGCTAVTAVREKSRWGSGCLLLFAYLAISSQQFLLTSGSCQCHVMQLLVRNFYGFVTTRLWRTVQLHVQNNSVTALRPLGCLSVCVCVCFSLSCTTRYLGGGACKSGTPEAVAPKAIKEGWPVPLALSLPANTCRLCLRHLKLSLFCSGYGLAAHILCFCKWIHIYYCSSVLRWVDFVAVREQGRNNSNSNIWPDACAHRALGLLQPLNSRHSRCGKFALEFSVDWHIQSNPRWCHAVTQPYPPLVTPEKWSARYLG